MGVRKTATNLRAGGYCIIVINVYNNCMNTKQKYAVKIGLGAEAAVLEKLASLNIKARPARGHLPHDIELMDGRRIEVKTRTTTTELTPDGRLSFRFILCRPGVKPIDRADFFILLINDDFFVIPTENISTCSSLIIPWPTGKAHRSKWSMYHNRFDLLK